MAKTPRPQPAITTRAEPKIIDRASIQVMHHLFKGLDGHFLKSNKYGPKILDRVTHNHMYHSVNSNGSIQKYTNMVGGHCHEITWTSDPVTGEMSAVCGPALKKVYKSGKGGTMNTVFERIIVTNHEDGTKMPDNHTHEMQYMGSDPITQAKVQAIQQANARAIGSAMVTKGNDAETDKNMQAAMKEFGVAESDRATE